MIRQGFGLLFFSFLLVLSAAADDYLVQKGDTATAIARKNMVPSTLLQKANPGTDWNRLMPGTKLAVPERYTVKAGDTLYSLSRLWGVDQNVVVAWNSLPGPSSLKVGQVLFLPPRTAPQTVQSPVVASKKPFWPVDKPPRTEKDKLRSVTFSTSGEPFLSVSAGTVVYLGEFRGVGRVLLVQGANRVVFAYGNFERSNVEYGQEVSPGQPLGVTSPRESQRLLFFAFQRNEALDVFKASR